jgi:hypothetical protein
MSRYDILLNDPKTKPPLPKEQGAAPSPPLARPTERPSDAAAARRADRPAAKRLLVRRGFEWYEDQLAALKKLSLKEQMAGKPGSMSQMVREAVDAYLRKRATEH